ncbi:cell wall-binding repeat-containing protein [Herbiconiux sp. CPCC 203407]|uniref:Cell wall-binding repeat-containing protein n=1 Tax=Herbiconiux oxytropis TaxID=2970915 RepID=A0AA41XFE0_9MICO|nr:cell wall-binding repeat-containing protein [Herbiconiux oxytropis]MCS5722968.1 cell wall-binding repeat-containing protein [Herbiconiux oxytropis]MCS5725220.1 cell wall-binding repeat-containing protein [Herbiconiux oxytropis]
MPNPADPARPSARASARPTRRAGRRVSGALGVLLTAVVLGSGLAGVSAGAAPADPPAPPRDPGARLVEFPLSNPNGAPNDIAAGADGSVWVSVYVDRTVQRMSRDGAILATVGLSGTPMSLASDNEGGVWATESLFNRIAHVSAAGVVKEYDLPTPGSFPARIFDGGDEVYYTAAATQKLGRLTESTGAIEEFAIAGAVKPWAIDGLDDQVWVTDEQAHRTFILGRDGSRVEYTTFLTSPTGVELQSSTAGVVTGVLTEKDEAFTFVSEGAGKSMKYYPRAESRMDLSGFALQSERLWYVDRGTNTIGVDGPGSAPVDFTVATADSGLTGVALTENRYVWSVAARTGRVIRLDMRVVPGADRVGGVDRFEMAVNMSRRGDRYGGQTVFVASGSSFADALSAGPLAAHQNAPILLTAQGTLPDVTRRELTRLDPTRVVVVGGPASVSDAVLGAIRRETRAKVERIGGSDRYAVSRALLASDLAPAPGKTLYVASGKSSADALSATPAAAHFDAGILLVSGGAAALSGDDLAVIEEYAAAGATVKIAGGAASVSAGIEAQLASLGPVKRFGGADRYEVSQAINEDAFPRANRAYFASGTSFPDALAGGAVAGSEDYPVYLTKPNCVPERVLDLLTASEVDHVTLLGGERTLTNAVLEFTTCG